MFKPGDIVQAKIEYLEGKETQESTMGVVVDYRKDNDYLCIGVLNPKDYIIPPIFDARGCCYEIVEDI